VGHPAVAVDRDVHAPVPDGEATDRQRPDPTRRRRVQRDLPIGDVDGEPQHDPQQLDGSGRRPGLRTARGRVGHGRTVQLTIGGWRVYRFTGAKRAGDTAGQGVGDTWFAVTPAGEKAVAGQ
jgi:hypothetical protein